MKRLLFLLGFILIFAFFYNCKSSYNAILNGEIIEQEGKFWSTNNSIDTVSTIVNERAWFQDSVGITQVCGIFSDGDDSRQINVRVIKYRFVDLRKLWAYEYANFKDTARIIHKFKCSDTARYTGGWKFVNRTPYAVDSIQLLPDTLINNVQYRKCKVSYTFNNTRFNGLGFFLCKKEDTFFQIDTTIISRVGCPMVFFRQYPITNPRSGFDLSIKFISNYFPDSVQSVFNAWKKNELTNPVE